MGKISSGKLCSLPYVTNNMLSSDYIGSHFDFDEHRCPCQGLCIALGCDRSWSWKAGQTPDLDSVKKVLRDWSAFRGPGERPSKIARWRQVAEFANLTKPRALETGYSAIVRLVMPWRNITLLCQWDEHQLAYTYDKATTILGSTMLTSKTLYFLVPDLFIILDRQQSYRALRKELHLPYKIDTLDGRHYAGMLSYIRQELETLIKDQTTVKLKDGSEMKITNVTDFRWLSPRRDPEGEWRPGTICKVVDDIFAKPS